jgi:uncharacterized protein YjbJ (UPF0337 family)
MCAIALKCGGRRFNLVHDVRLIRGPDGFKDRNSTQEAMVNRDQIKGRLKKAEGKIKEVTGKVIGDKTLEDNGKTRKILGNIQAGYGDLKSDLGKRG